MGHDPKSLFGFGDTSQGERPSHAERVAPRRSEAPKAPADAPIERAVGSTDYKAYGVMSVASTDCDVRKWKEMRMDMREGTMFDYRLLMMVQYSELDLDGVGMEIDLMFPDCIIRLIGRNLDELRQLIRRRRVSFVQEYSPMVYRIPVEKLPVGEPIITKVHVMQAGDALRTGETANSRPI